MHPTNELLFYLKHTSTAVKVIGELWLVGSKWKHNWHILDTIVTGSRTGLMCSVQQI